MSSTTLLLGVAGGVLCGASLVGALMIGFLWWQANQRSRRLGSSLGYYPATMEYIPPPNSELLTYQPSSSPSIPAPLVAPNAAGVRPGSIWLDGVGGMVAGQRIMITKDETILGRSGVCDVQFHDPKVSRQHAKLRLINGQYHLQDMQSTGGTYVNSKRITTHILADHDQIRMGDSVVIFRRQ